MECKGGTDLLHSVLERTMYESHGPEHGASALQDLNMGPVHCRTCRLLPSLCWYQILLLCDRGNTCLGLLHRVEPITAWSVCKPITNRPLCCQIKRFAVLLYRFLIDPVSRSDILLLVYSLVCVGCRITHKLLLSCYLFQSIFFLIKGCFVLGCVNVSWADHWFSLTTGWWVTIG